MNSCARAGTPGAPSIPNKLIRCAAGLLCCGLRWTFFGTEIFGQIIQKGIAIRVRDDGAEAFHFIQFIRPLSAREMLLSNAAGVVTLGAGGFDFSLHRSRRKRL